MHPVRRNTMRTQQMIAGVQRSVNDDPNVSIRHHVQQLNL